MPIKILRFKGGDLGFWAGGSAKFNFYGRGDLSES